MWRWLRLRWLLSAPIQVPLAREMERPAPPRTRLAWDHYELTCWLRAYRQRGLEFKNLPRDIQPAIYEIIQQEGLARWTPSRPALPPGSPPMI